MSKYPSRFSVNLCYAFWMLWNPALLEILSLCGHSSHYVEFISSLYLVTVDLIINGKLVKIKIKM